MKKALIYARSNQGEIDPQLAACGAYAVDAGYDVIGVFADGQHAASASDRSGFERVTETVAGGGVDVIIVESLDRLSRSLAELTIFFELCRKRRVQIEAPIEGKISSLNSQLRNVSCCFIHSDRSQKVARGQRAAVLKGKIFGSPGFGYDLSASYPRRRRIVSDQARAIAWAYDAYAAGRSLAELAEELNRQGFSSATGRRWRRSDFIRPKTGLLRNRIYIGQYDYGATRRHRQVSTGRVVIRKRPESEVVSVYHPELRIVADDQFAAAQRRLFAESLESKV
jgi:site-specific DNA recombinase